MSSPIIGIDLGTSNSCVAVYRDGSPMIVSNTEGQRTTPSVVTFLDDNSVLVGAPARRQAVLNPKRTIAEVKRLVGRRFQSDEMLVIRAISPYDVVCAANGDAWVGIDELRLSPPEVQSHILERLKNAAEQELGQKIDRAVITVPAYFDEAQREATRNAATIAGLDAARILNEPTAAALAYGHARSQGKNLAVVDLGGGTFDVTIMTVENGVFEVRASTGDMLLGGADFDRAVARHIADEVRAEHGVDILQDPQVAQRLIIEVESAKKHLTSMPSTVISLPFLASGPSGPINLERKLTREEFDLLTAALIGRLVGPCHEALANAGLNASQIDDVLLVGGMTRCAAVQKKVAEVFEAKPSLRINPDEAIGLGAALESGILAGSLKGVVLIDVAPHTLGLRAAGDKMSPLIPRSTPLPARVTKVFSTTAENQDHVRVEVLQGESEAASSNRVLGHVRLDGLPQGGQGKLRIAVTFSVDASGLLSVSAIEQGTGMATRARLIAESGLRRKDVERIAKERAALRG